MPFLKQLLKKMSAKLVEIMHLNPISFRAHGACSLDDPHPKFSPAIRIGAPLYTGWFRMKSSLSLPSSSYRISSNACTPSPERLMVLRNCLGMIISVSTFLMSSGAAVPETLVKASNIVTLRPVLNPRLCWLKLPCCTRLVVENERWPPPNFRTSERRPVTAAAAAIAGLTRCVRPPFPCRPSKLRFDVEAQRSPGSRRSAFMARHMEHPGSRHSKPASRKIWSRPSSSACFFTSPDPGTIIAVFMLPATLSPLATSAAALRSSILPLVQDPMNTLSTSMSSTFVPGSKPM
mmetsp:Transcript_17410/g.27818  ORF Transcript_17410/g.27818 Transcript_17410/m.27818 type:complete len:291 (-) Transcript_17410:1108-1980(-)